jgi:probable HAF family extracellular repeat protein
MAAAVLVGGFVVGSVATPAHATDPSAKQYHALQLSAPDGYRPFPNAVNNHREVAGRLHSLAEVRDHPAVWRNGNLSWLALPTGYSYGDANGINNGGVIVGESIRSVPGGEVTISAVYWNADGSVQTLPDLGGWNNRAAAVNDDGQIVGFVLSPTNEPHAARWTGGVLTDLGPGHATGINDRGQIAGTKPIAGVNHAVRWEPDGSVTDLGALVAGESIGIGINADGDVVGTSNETSNGLTTVGRRWHDGQAARVDTGEHTWTSPDRINDHGMMSGMASSQKASSESAVWIDGKIVDPTTMGVDAWVTGLNNNGDLIGFDMNGAYLYV